MVMNAEFDWSERRKTWSQKQADYLAAQQALDDCMTLYMQAKGPPPACQSIHHVKDLQVQMLEARTAVEEFIAAHASDHREKANLPRHE